LNFVVVVNKNRPDDQPVIFICPDDVQGPEIEGHKTWTLCSDEPMVATSPGEILAVMWQGRE